MKAVDLLYMGLGAAFMAKDKLEEFAGEMEKRGQMSQDETRKFVEDAKLRARQEEEAFNARLRLELRKVMEGMDLATKDDIEELKALLLQKAGE